MYSVLLVAMLTGTADQTQAWHWRSHGCHGWSCHGATCSGCFGSSCSGCYGSSCSGCFGGSCSGCCGGSYSSYGCNGFTGYTVGYTYWGTGCYGSSCFGGCYGCTGGIGCFGWSGGFAQPAVPQAQFTPAEQGGQAPAGGGTPGGGPPTANSPAPNPVTPPADPKGDKAPALPNLPGIPAPPGGGSPISHVSTTNVARVVIHVPETARVWVDQVACPLTGETRSFDTPPLQPGAQYAYTITVETADGRRDDRRVTMAAGRSVEVDFRGMNLETVQR